MSVISLFIALILVCLAIWAVQRIVVAFEIPPPIGQLIIVVVVVVAVLWLLGAVSGIGPVIHLR